MEHEPLQRSHARHAEHLPVRFEKDLTTLIEARLDRALQTGSAIDALTARMIAFFLATAPDSALARFAASGEQEHAPGNAELREEHLRLYHQPETTDEVTQLIDWLGTYLVDRDNAVPSIVSRPPGPPRLGNTLWQTGLEVDGRPVRLSVRADLPPHTLDTLADALALLIERYGDALLVFLSLSAVDASSPNLEESFLDCYRGSFGDVNELLRETTDLTPVERAVSHINETLVGGEFVFLDHDRLRAAVTQHFDVVARDGQLRVFER